MINSIKKNNLSDKKSKIMFEKSQAKLFGASLSETLSQQCTQRRDVGADGMSASRRGVAGSDIGLFSQSFHLAFLGNLILSTPRSSIRYDFISYREWRNKWMNTI